MGQCEVMHPKALLDSCSDLLKHVLKFDQPADMMLSKYFREFRLGPRDGLDVSRRKLDLHAASVGFSFRGARRRVAGGRRGLPD